MITRPDSRVRGVVATHANATSRAAGDGRVPNAKAPLSDSAIAVRKETR
jgi:hypothetical protein